MGRLRPPQAVQSRAARLVGLLVVGIALTLAAGYLLLPVAARMFIAILGLAMSAGIWLVEAAGSGQDRSTILLAVGRAMLRALTSPWALVVFGSLVSIGGLSLYALRRLLNLEEEESSQ